MSDSNELYHFGVKGQKWGVRRYQPYPKGKHGKFLGMSRDEDIHIKEGSVVFRTQSTSKLEGAGQTYVTFTPSDTLKYLSVAATGDGGVAMDMTMDNGNEGRPYSIKMKLTKDIIAPSYQATMDTFIDTVDQMGGPKKFAKSVNDGKYWVKEFTKRYKKLHVDELRDEAYIAFTKQFMQDTPARNLFFSKLKAQGYNAIVDDWDKRFDTDESFTESPMIIFDKSSSLRQTNSRAVTAKDRRFIQDYVDNEEFIRKHHDTEIKDWEKWMTK